MIDFKLFSAAQRVTYTFFVGRLSVFDDDYLKAEEMLTYALNHFKLWSIGSHPVRIPTAQGSGLRPCSALALPKTQMLP